MKILFFIGLLVSVNSLAATNNYCVGQLESSGNYGSIWGAFSYDFWCSDGTYKRFNEDGCFSENCKHQFRQAVEKNQIAALGYVPVKQTVLGQNGKKLFIYASVKNSAVDISKCDFAHKVTRAGCNKPWANHGYVKGGKYSAVEIAGTDSSGIWIICSSHSPVQKISHDTPGCNCLSLYLFEAGNFMIKYLCLFLALFSSHQMLMRQ